MRRNNFVWGPLFISPYLFVTELCIQVFDLKAEKTLYIAKLTSTYDVGSYAQSSVIK